MEFKLISKQKKELPRQNSIYYTLSNSNSFYNLYFLSTANRALHSSLKINTAYLQAIFFICVYVATYKFYNSKTESSKRVIAISDKLITVLTEYKAWYEEYREMHGDKWENSNRLFIGEYGGNIYPGTINMWMKRICQTAGLEERTVHSLRHTNITMQIAAGVPIVTVAGRAGHARTSTTTDIYSHFLKTADRSAAQKLEEIFD